MDPWGWITFGLQILLFAAILVGAGYNAKGFKYNRETFAAQMTMITLLQVRVHMMERILQQAGLVNFGLEDDEVKAEIEKLTKDLG